MTNEDKTSLIDRMAGAIVALPPQALPFAEILCEAMELHGKKSKDYGADGDPYANIRASEEFGVAPWHGALLRSNDKVNRLKQFAKKGVLANESAADSMLDLVVYFAITLMLYREVSK